MTDRRQFLKKTTAAAAALPFAEVLAAAPKVKPLKLLILGGTGYIGPHIVEAALARGHTMTLFNRGKTNPGLFPKLEKLQGDRKVDLSVLKDRKWDGVVDTSGYLPSEVKKSAELLAPNVGQYVFISTISVYGDQPTPDADETAPVSTLPEPIKEEVTNATYGALKALCEKAAEAAMPGRVTNLRPHLIVGPGDPTGRFTYWPVRVRKGGPVLAPNSPTDPIQFVDARDLAAFVVKTLEDKAVGVYNVATPSGEMTMGKLLESCNKVGGGKASLVWVDKDFLEAQKVGPWSEMPVWIPAVDENRGFGRASVARAVKAGLGMRPLEATVRDTLAWYDALPAEAKERRLAGIKPEKEAEVLKAWAHEQEEHKHG